MMAAGGSAPELFTSVIGMMCVKCHTGLYGHRSGSCHPLVSHNALPLHRLSLLLTQHTVVITLFHFRRFLRWIWCRHWYHCRQCRLQRPIRYRHVRHIQQVSNSSDPVSDEYSQLSTIDLTCLITHREVLQLTWWPLFRDCSFYIVSLLTLIWAFYDSQITW